MAMAWGVLRSALLFMWPIHSNPYNPYKITGMLNPNNVITFLLSFSLTQDTIQKYSVLSEREKNELECFRMQTGHLKSNGSIPLHPIVPWDSWQSICWGILPCGNRSLTLHNPSVVSISKDPWHYWEVRWQSLCPLAPETLPATLLPISTFLSSNCWSFKKIQKIGCDVTPFHGWTIALCSMLYIRYVCKHNCGTEGRSFIFLSDESLEGTWVVTALTLSLLAYGCWKDYLDVQTFGQSFFLDSLIELPISWVLHMLGQSVILQVVWVSRSFCINSKRTLEWRGREWMWNVEMMPYLSMRGNPEICVAGTDQIKTLW